MDIVSIKKYLGSEKPTPEHYVRFLKSLLNGISTHAVEANEVELSRFRQDVSDISGQLSVQSTAPEIETALEFVIRAVTGYNRIAARITQAHVHELQDMLAMMTRTIAFLSDSSKTGIEQLQMVEKNLHTAATIGDVRVLRARLNDCLVLVRNESARLREEAQTRIVELQKEVERTENHVRSTATALPENPPPAPAERSRAVPANDPLTGLQGRDAAEALIAANISQGKDCVVTLFLVDRLAQVIGRFGSPTGDEVLLMVAQYLGELVDAGSLFKWSGPAFASVTKAEESVHAIEKRMAHIAAKRFEKTIEINRRMILLPVTCSFMVQKVSDADSLQDIAETLDDFVASK